MGKSKKGKAQNNPTGLNSSNVKKKSGVTKKEQKSNSETVDKEAAKESEMVSVADNKEVNAEEETWDLKELKEEQLEDRKAEVINTRSLKDDNKNVQTPSGSNEKRNPDEKPSRVTKPLYDIFDRNTKKKSDVEYDNFMKLLTKSANIEYTKVIEINEDLFNMPKDYSLAHCVAEDLNMGSGIAVQFSSQFKRHGELSNQKQKQGGLAILSFPSRFIYYLVTKKFSSGKPNLQNMWNSLTKMQQHVQANNVKQVAIPRIGCGLDRLEWNEVKFMIEHIFKDTDVKITVCNFQQEDGAISNRKVIRKCKIFNVSYPLVEIEAGTMIVYFGTEDAFVNSTIEELDKKFRIFADYKRGPRALGQVVRTEAFNGDYLLFGFIATKSSKDALDYECVQKCAQEVNKINKKFGDRAYQYLALDMFKDPPEDDLQFNKVLNILRSTVTYVDVYVCYPKDVKHMMPRERERNDF